MRIARILTRLNLGGPARQVQASDPLLVERGHSVRILTGECEPGEGDLFDELSASGLDVLRVPGLARGIAPLREGSVLRRLRAELREFRPDVLHTHASKAGLLGRGAALLLPARERPARVHTFHGHVLEDYFSPVLSRGLVLAERWLARRTDRVVAVSHATGDDLVRLGVVGEADLVVIQPGVHLEGLLELPRGAERVPGELRSSLGVPPEAVLVGVLGRLAEVKRPELAIDVLERLGPRGDAVHLVYVGDGSARATVEERRARLTPERARRVHLAGARPDVARVLADLDVVLLVSRTEGMPVSLIEAAAAGLPVVASSVGGVPELVAHERTGFLGASVDELTYGLGRLLEQPDERVQMGHRARLRVSRTHSAERLADRLEELYGIVLAERASSGAEARP